MILETLNLCPGLTLLVSVSEVDLHYLLSQLPVGNPKSQVETN